MTEINGMKLVDQFELLHKNVRMFMNKCTLLEASASAGITIVQPGPIIQ